MKKMIVIILFCSFVSGAKASLGQDTVLLVEIAGTLAKDLQNSLEILEIAKDKQEMLQEAHNNITTKRMYARRVMRRMESIKRLKRIKINNIKDFNQALKRLKYEYKTSGDINQEVMKNYVKDDDYIEKLKKDEDDLEAKEEEREDLDTLEEYANTGGPGTSERSQAITLVMMLRLLHEMEDSNDKFHKSVLKRQNEERDKEIAQQKKKEAYRKWSGVKKDQNFWQKRIENKGAFK